MRARETPLRKFLGGSGIEEHRRLVDLVDPQYPFQLDLGGPAECTPNRDTELVSPHIGEPAGDQLLTDPFACLAERTIAVKHQRLALVPAHQTLDCGGR